MYLLQVSLFLLCACLIVRRFVPVKKCLKKISMAITGGVAHPLSKEFQEGWIMVAAMPTHVMTWGNWIEDPFKGDSLLIFMCGVPGITLFYQTFLDELYKLIKIPIWTISIAGHELPPPSTNLIISKETKQFSNVMFQISHKKEFVKQFVPKDTKLFLVGHSFGGKMVVELLKEKQVRNKVQKSILLMPTVEKFRESPRAKYWLTLMATGIFSLMITAIWILSFIPLSIKFFLARLYFLSRGVYQIPQTYLEALIHFFQPVVLKNSYSLALDELDAITVLDTEVFLNQKDHMKVYFAPDDYWAPLTHCESLKDQVPGLPVEVLDNRFQHAFTLYTAKEMADLLSIDLNISTPN